MSLFHRLLSMTAGRVQTEDVLTEVVAHLFRLDAAARDDLDDAVLVSWLKEIGAYEGHGLRRIGVTTQQVYRALPALGARPVHEGESSRPDLVIELDDGSAVPTRVMIESKVDSGEGRDLNQLRYYAEHLDDQGGGTLVYLTRDYDPKEPETILKHIDRQRTSFRSARWHGVAQHLRLARASAPAVTRSLYDDVLAFLTSLRMNTPPQFTPTDAVALGRIGRTVTFLRATLWDGDARQPPPFERFMTLTGASKNSGEPTLNRMRDYGRYVVRRQLPDSFEVLMGYQFWDDAMPKLVLAVGSRQADHADGIQAISARSDWQPGDSASGWNGAYRYRDLGPLLVGDDHAANVRQAFDEMLTELKTVQDETASQLPWSTLRGSGTDGDAGD